ncbi:MAG: arsenate reductase ArsC [Planctomycetota bacterium]
MVEPIRVAFVCVENANRSQMAEAFARMWGREHDVAVESLSAGSKGGGVVNPKAVASMQRLGYDMQAEGHQSVHVDTLVGTKLDAAVTMGCGDACPHLSADRHLDWAIPDPKHLDEPQFDEVRDLIQSKVDDLLEEIRRSRSSSS